MISFMQLILVLAGAVPLALAVNGDPAVWSFILPWLRPPYLHLVIHCIVIVVAAASCFGRGQSAPPARSRHLISVRTPPPAYYVDNSYSPGVRAAYESDDRIVELKPVMVNGLEVDEDAEGAVTEDDGEIALAGRTLTCCNNPPPEIYSAESRLEYFPPANPNGNIREKGVVRRETLESSWKKKSWGTSRTAHEEVQRGRGHRLAPDHFRYNMRKSKSFRERTIDIDSPSSRASYVNRKKVSQNREKLNRRVEFEDVPVDRSVSHKSQWLERFSPEFRTDYLSPGSPCENISEREAGEEYETMESAWKKITEAASLAAGQEENRHIGSIQPSLDRVPDKAARSSRLKEREGVYDDSPGSSRMEKELWRDGKELNRRVEAFIKKVNEEIRLCRKKSLDEYIQLNSAA